MTTTDPQYKKHMNEGNNAAWERDWATAVRAYSQAVKVAPQDADAHVNLGLALINDGQLERALKVYRKAQSLAPDDPLAIERQGDVLERMGQFKQAAQQYVAASDAYGKQRDLPRAVASWERATQLTPGLVSVHAKLAKAYERLKEPKKAIREYLTLAYNFKRVGEVDRAIQAVERALKIDENNGQALNTLRALQSGGEVNLPDSIVKRERPTPKDLSSGRPFEIVSDDDDDETERRRQESDPRGPVGEAMGMALANLAAYAVEADLGQAVMFATQGMMMQRQEDPTAAIDSYQQAYEAGLRHPALQMNLGGLLILDGQAQAAVPHLEGALNDRDLIAGALHGLGQAYYKMGDQAQAAKYLIESLQAVDQELADSQQERVDLTQTYSSILTALDGRTAEDLKVISERFLGMLSGNNWKQRIPEARRHLAETLHNEGSQGVFEIIQARGSDELADIVSAIDRFIRNGYLTLAMDEAHRAVERSPIYLPIHVRMAEVMMKEGRIRQAINKYNMVARSYMVRNDNERAASILLEVLAKAPLDVDVRLSLIELYENEERWTEALDQYMDLAQTYQQLGDFDRANQTFGTAERLGRRIDARPEKLSRIKHAQADIAQMRLNTRQAQKIYEEIIEIAPDDEKALRALVDLNYSQGTRVEGVKMLDRLLGKYAKAGEVQKILELLNQLTKAYPDDAAVRRRLAQMYQRMGRRDEAIEQLDALGEAQLSAGLTQEAADTIRQIISLKPDRVEEYQRLLTQLGG